MKKIYKVCITFLFCLLGACFPAYASVATPSDAELDEVPLIDDIGALDAEANVLGGNENNVLLMEILGTIQSIDSRISSFSVSTPSNADTLVEEETIDIIPYTSNNDVERSLLDAKSLQDIFVNCLQYDITVGGHSYTCLFPPECIDSLYVDKNNQLWNLSTKTIQGRLLDAGLGFDPLQEEGSILFLTPCLSNNFSYIRDYGSPNYIRKYYWNGSRYTYSDSYHVVNVDKAHFNYYGSDFWNYVFLFLIGGGVLLLWLRTYKRY